MAGVAAIVPHPDGASARAGPGWSAEAAAAGWPGELQLLVGPEAGVLLAEVARAAGATLVAWRPRRVDHRPGRSTVVAHRCALALRDGRTATDTFVLAAGPAAPRDGTARFADGTREVAVWHWLADPALPALAEALDRPAVAAVLDEAGIGGGPVQLRTRVHRPGRRAVVEATGRRGRLFLKIVRPGRARALHDLHRSLAPALPVPGSPSWRGTGLVALTALPGRTLREALRTGRRPVPAPAALDALLDQLPGHLAAHRPPGDPIAAAHRHAQVVAATVPAARGRLDDLLAALGEPRGDPGPVTAVHGDLHDAQVLVDGERVTGLLDVDTAGAGHRIDDLANLCAHLSVLARADGPRSPVGRYGRAVLAHAAAGHDRAELHRRAAAALVGLATGPLRVLDPDWEASTLRRLDLAAGWLAGRTPW